MSNMTAIQRALELQSERNLLLKAEADIEEGWSRLRDQQELLSFMRLSGQNTTEAERLTRAFQRTLIEWERHRSLIEQRIAYLQASR
jgi:hypothetical protein